MPKKILYFSLIIIIFGFPLLSLKFLPKPYLWIFLVWALTSLYGLIKSSNSNWKAVYLNVAVVFLSLGILELYLSSTSIKYSDFRIEYRDGKGNKVKLTAKNDLFGYAPIKDRILSAVKYYKHDEIYSVKYTIDETALRAGPKIDKIDENQECILFFGGSFTYGEGVNDNETLPYITEIKSKNNLQTYNFGYSGYGPHQMLSALESSYVKNIINCIPKFAIYSGMTGHIERSAGLSPWDTDGPRYVLKNGDVTHDGKFADKNEGNFEDNSALIARIIYNLKKSNILNKTIINYISNSKKYNNQTVALYLEIIDKARTVFEDSFSESEFHVLFYDHHWDGTNKSWSELILNRLKSRKINVHLISDILPQRPSEGSEYQISKHDNHPNTKAYDLIADYIVKNIIKNSSSKK